MKSINAKRIAAVAAGAALLGVGLAFAGPVTFQNVAIIGSSGQPLVQIVVGSKAQITDGIAAANIAAAIGNLAYTTVGVTASVNAASASALHVTVTNPSALTISGQQVWLNQTGAAYAAGSYSFSALIGSVLNRGIQVGSPASTKALQTSSNYAYLESFALTTSPAPSPYYAASGVPVSTVTKTTGGGVSFTSFTQNSYDNILQITNSQQSGLLNNAGQYGETENLWVTGFPVYNQQLGAFALMSAGGAYQVTFSKTIPVTSGAANSNGVIGINNAAFTFLGQNWTIIGFKLPGATASNSTHSVSTVSSTTVVKNGGQVQVASSLSPMTTVYVGQNVTASNGQFSVQLTDIGQPNGSGASPAAINLYYNGKLVNVTAIGENTTQSFNISGTKVYVKVGQTFAGLYAYQKYAKIQIYSNVFVLKDGQVFNQTYDPGWKVNLLWGNTSSSTGNETQLQSILVYNNSPTTLTQGQSLSFIGNPSAWKLEFLTDNLGNNYDPLNFKTSSTGSITYKNVNSAFTATPTGAASGIQNVTEPAQFLTVGSGISNAFSYGGQTSQTVIYDLTPYYLVASNTLYGPLGTGNTISVTLADSGNFVNTNNPLTVTVKGSNGAASATNASVFYKAGVTTENTVFTNITTITLSTAYPGLTVTIAPQNSLVTNTISLQTISPTVQYLLSGQTTYSQASGSTLNYNQQNGQPISTFTLTGPTLPSSPLSAVQYFNYKVSEYAIPGNTATDSLSFAIYNATSGSGASPLFWLNASVGTQGGTPGTRNNMTYTSLVSAGTLNAPLGFRTERGSQLAAESATSVTINYATIVDQLLFAVAPSSSAPSSSTQRQYGPYIVGQAVSIPGVNNVTISKVTATATLSGSSGYTITGISNLTATPSVSTALQPVWLKNLTTTPLVILDSQANPASSLILIGSGYVNTLSQQVVPWSNYTGSTTYLQAFGNKILVAGYSASQTTAEANAFIQDLYAAASTT